MTEQDFENLVARIQLNYSETEPSNAYYECEDEYGEIMAGDPIWELVDDAIKFAVEQTVVYIAEHPQDAPES